MTEPTWPSVEDAMRRINVLIGDQAETDMAARELIVVMRELGRVTAENADLRRAALAAEPASGEAEYDLKCVNGHDKCYEGPFDGCPYCERVYAAPSPPPTQGEEETARRDLSPARALLSELQSRDGEPYPDPSGMALIDAALRQRADEATRAENEACAKLADYGDDRFIAAAIRARIAPRGT